MNEDTVYPQVIKDMCEAVNCYAKATSNIKVKLGNSGRTIALNLCNNCVKKFQEDIVL